MKKAVCFFCDITGTLRGKVENCASDYDNFNNILLKLKDNSGSDVVIFSLISSDPLESVSQNSSTLQQYLKQSILFGRQFFGNGYILGEEIHSHPSAKTEQIINYLKNLSEEYQITCVYYADDCEFFHEMMSLILEYQEHDFSFVPIIPKDRAGLREVNALLTDKMKNEEKKHKMTPINRP